MRLLVTGGLGFIGSNFIQYWFGRHPRDSIINLDKVTYAADFANVSNVDERCNYSFIKGDICDRRLIKRLAADVDAIINFAAETHVDNSIRNSDDFVKSNILGVHSILNAVKETEVRFHQVSTDEVYGSLPLHSKLKFTERSRYNPNNPYSASKAAADHLVNSYYNTYKLPVTISNCSNNFGPNQHPEKLIPKVITSALFDKKIPIYGDGMQVRDWIYVEDHCSALEIIIKKGAYGDTYLVSSNSEAHNIEIVKKLLKMLGKDTSLLQFVADRPGHDVRYALDPSKIRRELKWAPKYTLSGGLKLTMDHYISNIGRYAAT
jgi:dTDP-glucose 4,6-dehydratase